MENIDNETARHKRMIQNLEKKLSELNRFGKEFDPFHNHISSNDRLFLKKFEISFDEKNYYELTNKILKKIDDLTMELQYLKTTPSSKALAKGNRTTL